MSCDKVADSSPELLDEAKGWLQGYFDLIESVSDDSYKEFVIDEVLKFFDIDRTEVEILYEEVKEFCEEHMTPEEEAIISNIHQMRQEMDKEGVGGISLDRTDSTSTGSYEELLDALVGCRKNAGDDSISFSKENLEKTLNDIVRDRDVKKVYSWISLAGGKQRLVTLLNNLKNSFNTKIPDEFYDVLDQASKEWRQAPSSHYLRKYPKEGGKCTFGNQTDLGEPLVMYIGGELVAKAANFSVDIPKGLYRYICVVQFGNPFDPVEEIVIDAKTPEYAKILCKKELEKNYESGGRIIEVIEVKVSVRK